MDIQAVIEFLGNVPVLQRLPSSSIRMISQVVVLKHYDSGEYVFREGEAGEGIYFIWEGEVEVSRLNHANHYECSEFRLKEYDHFGHCTLGAQQEDIIASTKVTCLLLPHNHCHMMHAKSIWSGDATLGAWSPVERILHLKPLEVNFFQGTTLRGAPQSAHVFGGQFMGQALAAASKTVHFLKNVHSFHAYFLVGGNVEVPIVYQVHRLHDGKNFSTRRVDATQKERVVFFLLASFQKEEKGFEHQEATIPSVLGPELLLPKTEMEEGGKSDPRVPKKAYAPLTNGSVGINLDEAATATYVPWPTEIRICESMESTDQTKRPPSVKYWLRAKGILSNDQALHRCVAAYFSDMLFIQVSLNPHRGEGRKLRSLSLDHSMWFHRDIKADDWVLFVINSPTSSNARGFCSGQMFNRNGELLLSVMQVGLLRQVETSSAAPTSKL